MYVIFFFNDTATTEIYTLSLHDALPILLRNPAVAERARIAEINPVMHFVEILRQPLLGQPIVWRHWYIVGVDRKSTRLNSSHANISYAVFCLKKKKKQIHDN